jgi:putative ABC transport system permease protein
VSLKPLTYPDPQSLFEMRIISPQGSFPGANVPKFNIWHQQTGIFQQVAAYDFGGAGLNITGGDHPEQVQGSHVSADFFALFGAPVVAGRTFSAAEDSPRRACDGAELRSLEEPLRGRPQGRGHDYPA